MPKTRAYTREELQSLRRADLQRLCKTYDIKGDNAKSDVLIDILAKYFTSPAYLASPRPEPSRSRPASRVNPPARPLHGPISRAPSRARPAAPFSRPPSTQSVPVPGQSETSSSAARTDNGRIPVVAQPSTSNTGPALRKAHPHAQAKLRPNNQAMSQSSSRVELSPRDLSNDASDTRLNDVASLREEVSQLREVIAKWDEEALLQSLERKMEERINTAIAKQMELVKQQEVALVLRETALANAWARLEEKLGSDRGGTDEMTASAPKEAILKRKERDADLPQQPNQKRMRVPSGARTPPHSSSALASEPPSTPDSSLGRVALPCTPPGPNRDLSNGPSMTPTAHMTDCKRTPPFATGPKPPGEVESPSVDRPDRPKRKGDLPQLLAGGSSAQNLHKQHTRRKPSQAHIDLSVITESESEREAGPSRVPFLGSIRIPDRSTVTPPSLSPSPAIGGDNFSYTPLPPPFSVTAPSSSAASRVQHQQKRFSPAREYMNIALNGLTNPNDSPSALATPSSRTMLGTERFRDTRFADEPIISWGSPKVDFGPETPTH